jgi:hypothetical protein
MQNGTTVDAERSMGANPSFAQDVAAIGLVQRVGLWADVEDRKAARDGRTVQHLVRQAMVAARTERARDEIETRLGHLQRPGTKKHLRAARGPQRLPQRVGPLHQRHVVGALEIGQADDPCLAVARPPRMRQVELFEAEHALATARQMIQRRRPHAADAHDDRVECLGHAGSLEWQG